MRDGLSFKLPQNQQSCKLEQIKDDDRPIHPLILEGLQKINLAKVPYFINRSIVAEDIKKQKPRGGQDFIRRERQIEEEKVEQVNLSLVNEQSQRVVGPPANVYARIEEDEEEQ